MAERLPFGPGRDAFAAALLSPDLPVPEGVTGPGGRPAGRRFGVYRNNVVVSLTESLKATYPAVARLVGEDYFSALARLFIGAHPPVSPILSRYGQEFSRFVADFSPLAAYPYLADVASFEWAWLQSYHAADAVPLDPAELAAISPEVLADIRFLPHPAARLLASAFPVFDLVVANRFEPDRPLSIDLSESQTVLFSRPDIDVMFRVLPRGTAVVAEALLAGQPLGQAAELGLAAEPGLALPQALSVLLAAGIFTGVADTV
ncbi:DUF2063 domain-containing protein [Microvirga tunisiensis]|uniref:DUF2063 domain-containing protein n=1 Tax=Pannonibacter tanglangensis TaxID=2750084 RepID=A0A7X5F4N2_9HYPH|nr:DNA-binding domain-containing protein [Pannonibacter sp. XCT-53]NBN79715.1 DUF2063 domain-containing protein [Pannonibacter sp. XCT-53]